MTYTAKRTHGVVAVTSIAVLLGLSATATAQPSDITANIQVDTSNQEQMEIVYVLSGNRMRMDMPEVSVVTTSGANESMLMIQHPEQQYLRVEGEQLQMMQQMMGQFGGGGSTAAPDTDFGAIQFEETGATEQVGPWTAFEVQMTGPDGETGALWLTEETEIGLFEIMLRAADAAQALSSPMAGGTGAAQQFLQYQALAQAQDLPDGRVVRIVSEQSNDVTTTTLTGVSTEPVSGETFEPPAGYEEMQVPSFGGLGGFGQ